jgi:hypothetical protein
MLCPGVEKIEKGKAFIGDDEDRQSCGTRRESVLT